MPRIYALQLVDYDPSTQVIQPRGPVQPDMQNRADISTLQYQTILPELVGWAPFNRLIKIAGAGYALIEEGPHLFEAWEMLLEAARSVQQPRDGTFSGSTEELAQQIKRLGEAVERVDRVHGPPTWTASQTELKSIRQWRLSQDQDRLPDS